jgi:excinuclease UvrABC nuclease subunit
VLELDCGLSFQLNQADDFLSAVPARPAVCLIELKGESAEPLLIRTQDLRRRLQRLLGPPDPTSKRLNLREVASGVRYRLTGSRFEQTFTYYHQAKAFFPKRYQNMLRLRPPACLKVNLRNAYPRCYATRHIAVDDTGKPTGGAYYGPFASRRSAEAFAGSALDFFKVRRCQIKIRRDPAFPGCMYSEMKMCLAPCFAGCTKEDYDFEVEKLVQFLDTSGGSLRNSLEQERETASEQLDFERAATLHKKIEKLDDALRGSPELPRRIQDLNAVILQRSAEDQSIAIYAVRSGWLAEPAFIRFAEIAGQPRSAEHIFREYLERAAAKPPHEPASSDVPEPGTGKNILSEHLWMVARWYYSNPREGEIFFRDKDWPYRRIMRGCSRLLAPKPESSAGNAPLAPAS